MKVFIKIVNIYQTLNIYADDNKNEVLVNCTPIDFDAIKFVGDISLITLNWNDEYVNNSILDGEECKIKIMQDDKERIIKCKNAFPLNYGEFKETINKVVELWN